MAHQKHTRMASIRQTRECLSWRTRGLVMARSYLRDEDRFLCNWCCARLTEAEVVIDHYFPLALGGTNSEDNLVVACQSCNSIKKDAHPSIAEVRINARIWGGTR